MTKQTEGCIIAFDGPDGVGKTTQIHLLADFLRSQGYQVHATRASGGTPIGEALRSVSLSDVARPAEADVYISLAMHTALGQDLQRRKQAGQICLVDRSPLAILAYNTYASQLPNQTLGEQATLAMLQLWHIDSLLLFEAPQVTLNKRRTKRTDKPADYFEKQGTSYFERVQAGYHAAKQLCEQQSPPQPVTVIDATPSVAVIQTSLRQVLQSVLPLA